MAFQRTKFLIVRMPIMVIAVLTPEISREKPKYEELTNFNTCVASPGSASMASANSAGPLAGLRLISNTRIALCGKPGNCERDRMRSKCAAAVASSVDIESLPGEFEFPPDVVGED